MSIKIDLPVTDHPDSGMKFFPPTYLQTTDGSTQTIVTISPPANSNVTVFALVSGSRDDDSAGAGGTVMGVFRRGTGDVTGVGSTMDSQEDSGSGTPAVTITTSGANIVIQVAGLASENWNWTCGGFYVVTDL